MEKTFASFTFFTFLLLAVSTARISLDPPATTLPVVHNHNLQSNNMKSLPAPDHKSQDSNIILPSETPKSSSESDRTARKPEMKTFKVDLTPRSDYARFHAINRHFFDQPRIPVRSVHRRPNRHFVNPFVVPRSEISHGNEVLFGETKLHRQAPLKRLKANKRDYGHRRHRHQQQRHFRHVDNNNEVSVQKRLFSREKLKSLERQQQKEMKSQREHEAAGLMKNIRKFLKHTFD